MNRSDWVVVGVLLYGVHTLVSGVLMLGTLLQEVAATRAMDQFEPSAVFMNGVGPLLVRVLAGAGLVLWAPGFGAWLVARDALARRGTGVDPRAPTDQEAS